MTRISPRGRPVIPVVDTTIQLLPVIASGTILSDALLGIVEDQLPQ